MTQTLIPGTETPLLAAIDPGISDGYLVRNLPDGSIEHYAMPVDKQDRGMDLHRVAQLLDGYDHVLMEHPPLHTKGKMHLTENSCHAQYKELYGLMMGLCYSGRLGGFETIRPQDWQGALSFPKQTTLLSSREHEGRVEYLVNGQWQELHGNKGKDKLSELKRKVWKSFLHAQASQRFPTIKKIPIEAGAAYLLYRLLTQSYAK